MRKSLADLRELSAVEPLDETEMKAVRGGGGCDGFDFWGFCWKTPCGGCCRNIQTGDVECCCH